MLTQFILDNHAYKTLMVKRYMNSVKIVEQMTFYGATNEEINEKISIFNMELPNISFYDLLNSNHDKFKLEEEPPIDMYILADKKYLHFNPENHKPRDKDFILQENYHPRDMDFVHPEFPMDEERPFLGPPPPKHFDILLMDTLDENLITYFLLLILLIIDIVLLWFYLFIKRKLLPLSLLKQNMIHLSKGDLSISMKSEGKDEISQVSNEFDNAIKQLKQLRDSRNLFLRNIMHELKTPITKGKLITDMYDECERKHILIRVFQRLEYLLNEFAKIEELTSGKIVLQKDDYTVYDLIEQSFDILLLDDDKIDLLDNYDLQLNVDFELFSIALKNLIDNAISYNTNGNPKIFIEKDSIKIVNKGEKLKKDIEEYYKPFNREYETATSGLGLGLYISNNIIKIHNFKLEYEYIDGHHNFVIKLN